MGINAEYMGHQSAMGDGLSRLSRAAESALAAAKNEASAIIGGSFLQDSEVFVKVMNSPGMAKSTISRMDRAAGVVDDIQRSRIQTAEAEFGSLAKAILSNLRSSLRSSFFASSNVRVRASSTPYPSPSDMLQHTFGAEQNMDRALESKILDMQVAFCRALNSFIASKLHRSSFAYKDADMSQVETAGDAGVSASEDYVEAAQPMSSFLTSPLHEIMRPLMSRMFGSVGSEYERTTQSPLIFLRLSHE